MTGPATRASTNRWRYAVLAALGVCAVVYQAAVTADMIDHWDDPHPIHSVPFTLRSASRIVDTMSPGAARDGLRIGDEIAAFNGKLLVGAHQFTRLRQSEAETVVRREGREIPLRLKLVPGVVQLTGFQQRLISAAVVGFLPWLSLALGFWVAAVRPRDIQAWLLLAVMLSFHHLVTPSLVHLSSPARELAWWFRGLMYTAFPVSMILFGVYFAERLYWDRDYRWVKWALAAPTAATGLAFTLLAYLRNEAMTALPALQALLAHVAPYFGLFQMVGIGYFFFCTGWKWGTTKNPDTRRRLRFLLTGGAVAMTPMFFLVLQRLFRGDGTLGSIPASVLVVALLATALFPLTLAYLVVVHRALDVRVAVRQGIQYALVSGGANVFLGIVALNALVLSLDLAFDPNLSRPQKFARVAAGFAALALLLRLRTRIASWIDSRFFREAYDAERVLSELADEVREIVDEPSLLRTVGQRVAATLHVPRLAFMLSDKGVYRPAYVHGFENGVDVTFPESAAAINHLRQVNAPERVYPDDMQSWIYRAPGMTAEDRGRLQALEAQLVLPMAIKEKLIGFISLGQKRSEEPYSRSDLRLLRSLATQTGLAIDNSRLAEAYAAEAAKREKLNREVEIAREVQERLFPQKMPAADGIDLAAACRPALGVGGDYYDYLLLADGGLLLVIGDVAGKGIAAALLMASLQASMRGNAATGCDLADVVSRVNSLIYESSAANRYATLFCAKLDPATLRLDYVNAGHNPPILLREDGSTETLTAGGTVVGLLPRFPYQQGTVQLFRGDVLLTFTDGISEAQNAAEEEWGEERLIASARAAKGGTAAELFDRILADVDAFVAGAPQHDDMTMLIARAVK